MLEDRYLILRFNRGDRSVLHRIYDKYKNDLVTLAAALLMDVSLAEDVVHDVFISFLGSAGRFRLTIGVRGKNGASVSDKHTGQFTFYLSERYGFRRDISGGGATASWFVPPESDTLTMVIPAEKKWSKTPLPPEERGKMPEPYEDPAEYIKRFIARPYKELGRSVIDGVEVEGIEVTDPPIKDGRLENGIGRMWVDVQTELPVRIEIDGAADGTAVQWLMEFKWSEAVDPTIFDPSIPSDYTPLAP